MNMRCFVTIKRAGRLDVVTAPWPWRTPSGDPPSRIDIAVPTDPSLPVSVAVRDPAFGALLGYLTNGSLTTARQLLAKDSRASRLALESLYRKVDNPYAAVAGAYVLTQGGASTKDASWHEWVDNLSNWFPWLPDGPILRGSLLLQERDPDLGAVSDAFSEGFSRGLPVYTSVFRLLFEGATMLRGDSGGAPGWLEHALPILDIIAGRLDPGQPFTTIRLGDA